MSVQNATRGMSRREFVKAAGVAAATLAAAPLALQTTEARADVDWSEGTHTVSANIQINPGWLPSVIVGTPYATNTSDPEAGGDFPTSKVTNNATLTVSGGVITLNIPGPLNPCFEITDMGTGTGATVTDIVWTDALYHDDNGDPTQRINGLTFQLDNTSGSYAFTGGTQYAGYSKVSLMHGWHNFDMTLIVE